MRGQITYHISEVEIARYSAVLGRKGVTFQVGTTSAIETLAHYGASGLYDPMQKIIYLRAQPTRSEFYEEVIHAFQDLNGVPDTMTAPHAPGTIIDRHEYEAQRLLFSKRHRLKIPNEESRTTIRRLWRLSHGYEHM